MRPRILSTLAWLALLAGSFAPRGHAGLPDIYPDATHAKRDLESALQVAAAQHHRIIVDFGGNWCGDCHVLDGYFHDATNGPLLEANYVLVHINIGRRDQNLDIAAHYGIPLEKGVPALAILDTDGRLIYSQKAGEFEAMRRMESASVTQFLNQWKPDASRAH